LLQQVANNPKPSRLKSSAQFAYIKTNGKTLSSTPWLLSNYCENKGLGLRVGWTIPSYVGNAVLRNRLKRWMRNHLRHINSDLLNASVDINLVLRKKTEAFYRQLEHEVLDEALAEIFKKINRSLQSKRTKSGEVHN
jgi:ribonuclease P protein component